MLIKLTSHNTQTQEDGDGDLTVSVRHIIYYKRGKDATVVYLQSTQAPLVVREFPGTIDKRIKQCLAAKTK